MKLEKQFYISYINNIKLLLHETQGTVLKQEILDILKNGEKDVSIKFDELINIVTKITNENFEFIHMKMIHY